MEIAEAFAEAALGTLEGSGGHAADVGVAGAVVHGSVVAEAAVAASADLVVLAAAAVALALLLAALLAALALLTLLATLALLTLLAALALLALLTLLTLLALLAVAGLLLALSVLALLVAAAGLFDLLAGAFQAFEGGFETGLLTGAFALFLGALVAGFFHAVGEAVEGLGDRLFAEPDVGAVALAQVLAHELHFDVDVFAVEFAEGLTDLGGGALLGRGEFAGGVLDVLLQGLVVVHQAELFLGELLVLLRRAAARGDPVAGLFAALGSVGLAHAVGEIALATGQAFGAAGKVVELIAGRLLLHAAEDVAGFVQTFGGAAGFRGVVAAFAHVFGGGAQAVERLFDARVDLVLALALLLHAFALHLLEALLGGHLALLSLLSALLTGLTLLAGLALLSALALLTLLALLALLTLLALLPLLRLGGALLAAA